MLARTALLFCLACPIVPMNGPQDCLVLEYGAPICDEDFGRVSANVHYLCAFDSNERKELCSQALGVMVNYAGNLLEGHPFPYGIIDVWPGRSIHLTTVHGNGRSTQELQVARDVEQGLQAIRSRRPQLPSYVKFVIIVIEFVTASCQSIEQCRRTMEMICHRDNAHIIYLPLNIVETMNTSSPFVEMAPHGRLNFVKLFQRISNCVCSYVVQTQKSIQCLDRTMDINAIVKAVNPSSRRPPSSDQTDDQEVNTTLYILIFTGIALVVALGILGVLYFKKYFQMQEQKNEQIVSKEKVKVSKASHEPGGRLPSKPGRSSIGMKGPQVQSGIKLGSKKLVKMATPPGGETTTVSVNFPETKSSSAATN